MATIPTYAEIMDQEMHISDDMVPNIIATNAVCFTISCVAVILRFVSRRLTKIKYEADDWLILAGLVRYRLFFELPLTNGLYMRCIQRRLR